MGLEALVFNDGLELGGLRGIVAEEGEPGLRGGGAGGGEELHTLAEDGREEREERSGRLWGYGGCWEGGQQRSEQLFCAWWEDWGLHGGWVVDALCSDHMQIVRMFVVVESSDK